MKAFLPRQVGWWLLSSWMLSVGQEIPAWRSRSLPDHAGLGRCWSLSCLKLTPCNWIQMFLLQIFRVLKKDTAFSTMRSYLIDIWVFKFFLLWLDLGGDGQILLAVPVIQVTVTLGFGFGFGFKVMIVCFFTVSQHYHLHTLCQTFWVTLFPGTQNKGQKVKKKKHK